MQLNNIKIYDEKALINDLAANHGRSYQQCSMSVMDTISDPLVTFDEQGVSNYYAAYKRLEKKHVLTGKEGEDQLETVLSAIKKAGKGKQYDCITGISGGVDSTYLALMIKKWGLRPLVVHFDNGWNSELAVKNIENIVSRLNFDLYTLVVDWNEFRDLQLAYLKASVVDIEAITDHAILATMYKLALKNDIKYILSGTNVVTEAILPSYWIYPKADHVNIRSIHKKFGTIPLKTYPFFSTKLKKQAAMKGITSVSPLNYIPYNKAEVKEVIKKELEWRDYGGKHYESVFTRFYQGYILPAKFSIDKRKAHLSTLIFSGQITKQEALESLKEPIYDQKTFEGDYEFVLKKLGLSHSDFQDYINQPRREHREFGFEASLFQRYPILRPFKPFIRTFQRLNNAQK